MSGWVNELRLLRSELLSQLKDPLDAISILPDTDEENKRFKKYCRDELNDIKDIIDNGMATHMMTTRRSLFRIIFTGRKRHNLTLAQGVEIVREENLPRLIDRIKDFSSYYIPRNHEPDLKMVTEANEFRKKMRIHIVGFEEETQHLVNFLNSKSSKLEVASIVGMPGLGKSTLAWKIFNDPVVTHEFPYRIWVTVSNNHNIKDMLLRILRNFISNKPDMSVEELAYEVKSNLIKHKVLIVMDDVWTPRAWDDIKKYILPKDNEMIRVLVTTRHTHVAKYASEEIHHLRLRKETESWEIFHSLMVFDKLDLGTPKLMELCRNIATKCDGHPLSIVIIEEFLALRIANYGGVTYASIHMLEHISLGLDDHLLYDNYKLLSSIISLSFENMKFELKTCLFYLGLFPKDADIPINKLLRLWIAEGFIEDSEERNGKRLEQTAFDYLEELIDRNLVMVKETKLDGKPKTCHIHNSIRLVCKEEARYENLNLFEEITKSDDGELLPSENIEKFSRICIHSHVLNFLMRNKKHLKARSFLSFSCHPILLETEDMDSVIDGFDLLRVYDCQSIKFPTFPQKFTQLIHLRYLVLVLEQCTSLPGAISKLWNLQTLTIDVSSDSTLEIKASIWEMMQLRHLKTNASITLKKNGRGKGGKNLQVLSRLSPESFTREVVKRAKNLITLGIQGELNKLAAPEGLKMLYRLQKLKLVNCVSTGVAAENPICPPFNPVGYPPNLTILVLTATYMNWKEMSTLAMLQSLEVLKLKENAFAGSKWVSRHTFHNLKGLHIEKATELKDWKVIGDPFPKLEVLLLNDCENLIEVPSAIYKKLRLLSMERVTKTAVSSAQAIHEETHGAFKLEIPSES